MRVNKIFFVLLLLLVFTSLSLAETQLRTSFNSLRPGDFLIIKVTAPEGCTVNASFLGTAKQLQFYNGCYTGLIASSYYTKPGTYTLHTEINCGQEKTDLAKQIEVTNRSFPEDHITIPEKKRQEIITPANQAYDNAKGQEVRSKANQEQSPPLWNGAFIWPVNGRITTNFGLIRFVNEIENGRHSGLDIAAVKGTPVLAVNQGKVIFAGTLYATGLTVIVHHGLDLYTTYGHLSKIEVQEGDVIDKGKEVGLVGMTGLATGPHLHLTFRVGEIPVDPYLFLGKEINI